MEKTELISRLNQAAKNGDIENAHISADNLLLEYINDEDIEEAFRAVPRWYA